MSSSLLRLLLAQRFVKYIVDCFNNKSNKVAPRGIHFIKLEENNLFLNLASLVHALFIIR